MPLLKTWKEDNGRWGIWQVTETIEELCACLSDNVVRQELEHVKASSRKMEYLAVRVLLKTMLGKEVRIGHELSGKPFLTGGEYHVSISHTKGYVAVGLHKSVQPGIDIEAYGERVRKVEARFVREDEMPERTRMESREELYQLLLHWSAKETMYKVLDMEEVDFLQHLKVCPFKLSPFGTFAGESYREADKVRFLIQYLIHPDFVCTYCLKRDAGSTIADEFGYERKR